MRPGPVPAAGAALAALAVLAALLPAAPAPPASATAQESAASPLFRDVAREAGLAFQHHSAPEKKYILESMSGGVALLDFDDDGRPDIYFVDALTVETAREPKAARSALYRNLGGMRFQDVTERAGVGHPGWGMGACVGDFDGDGWQDLYVTAYGPTRLYRNNRDGTFTDAAVKAGVVLDGWSTGCGFADYDRDGDLDLFVARYVHIDLAALPEFGKDRTCEFRGIAVQCGPRGLPGEGDVLFRNEGDGRFSDVSQAAGVSDPRAYYGLGVAWLDFDEDGWLDLYVANDATPSFLYLNQKDGTFKEVGFPMGVAVSEDGAEQGCMGVAVGDYDNDRRFDLYVTTFAEEYFPLRRGDGAAGFVDVSFRSGTAAVSLPYVGWGTAFLDYDNDGWQDLIAVNGHVYPQLDKARLGASAPYRQRRLLYRNSGNGRFEEVAARLAPVLMEERVSRGLALGDLDDDGRVDVVINDLDGPAQLLRNEGAGAGNWLGVRLRGKGKNTGAVGAIVRVTAGGRTQSRLVRSGTSYISQDDMRQHFGLGPAKQAELLEVLWPGGSTTRREGVKAGQFLTVEQGR